MLNANIILRYAYKHLTFLHSYPKTAYYFVSRFQIKEP